MLTRVSRREFIAGAVAGAAAVSSPSLRAMMRVQPGAAADLLEMSAVDAVAAMTKGDVTAERYASALLARCEAAKALNAFITMEPERVLQAARDADRRRTSGARLGPLHGLPIPIKDSINTKDLPTSGGTRALRAFRAKADAPIVKALIDAGAIVQGKTNLHELSFGWTSSNLAFGAVRNPYDPARIPGGSSGGTAVAVASRMAPLGVAEDTEGSIRVPAAMCGIAGLRPTTGRYNSTGVVPISARFDQVGPHARSVADLVLFDGVITGEARTLAPANLKGVKLAVVRDYHYSDLAPDVERMTAEALQKLRDAGVVIVEIAMPDLGRLIDITTIPIQLHEVVPALKQYLAEHETGVTFEMVFEQLSSDVKGIFTLAVLPRATSAAAEQGYRAAVDTHLPRIREMFREQFAASGATAIIFPTTMVPPVTIGTNAVSIRGKSVPFQTAISRNIAPGGTASLPGLVLPAGLTAGGLPVSLELDGPVGSDRALLSLGLSVERVLGRIAAPKIG